MSIKVDYKISDILHDAADKELAHDQETYWGCDSVKRKASLEQFSCCAIDNAVTKFLYKKYPQLSRVIKDEIGDDIFEDIKKRLEAMGLNTDSTNAFGKEPYLLCPDIQGQRYFWLKWAALMVEEQVV